MCGKSLAAPIVLLWEHPSVHGRCTRHGPDVMSPWKWSGAHVHALSHYMPTHACSIALAGQLMYTTAPASWPSAAHAAATEPMPGLVGQLNFTAAVRIHRLACRILPASFPYIAGRARQVRWHCVAYCVRYCAVSRLPNGAASTACQVLGPTIGTRSCHTR